LDQKLQEIIQKQAKLQDIESKQDLVELKLQAHAQSLEDLALLLEAISELVFLNLDAQVSTRSLETSVEALADALAAHVARTAADKADTDARFAEVETLLAHVTQLLESFPQLSNSSTGGTPPGRR
jgi:hypothetical protein